MVRIDCSGWLVNGEWASSIRRSVFIEEQGIDESEEWDQHDANSIHAVAWYGEQAVGTARLLPDGKLGRMAVIAQFRNQGIGSAMLLALLELARQTNILLVRLSAQEHALKFYARHGFMPIGKPHVEVGISHQWMELTL